MIGYQSAEEDIMTLIIMKHRLLRDHSLTTSPGSGFISPITRFGVDGAIGALIGLTVGFLFFTSLYLMWRVYIRGKYFVPLEKVKQVPVV
jgi:hypothetical protein